MIIYCNPICEKSDRLKSILKELRINFEERDAQARNFVSPTIVINSEIVIGGTIGRSYTNFHITKENIQSLLEFNRQSILY